jgi:Ca2+-binding EF-hand superfamily protein
MNRMRAGAILLAGLAAGCASGPPGPPGGGPPGDARGGALQESKITRPIALLFTSLDTNDDLIVSEDELTAAIPREFANADADQSGVLTGFEMADWCASALGDKEAQPDLRAMDNDMNYTVTEHEFAVALQHEFDRLDRNQDGRLTRAEMLMDAPRSQMGGPGGQQGAPQGQGGGRGRPPGGGRGPGGGGGQPF